MALVNNRLWKVDTSTIFEQSSISEIDGNIVDVNNVKYYGAVGDGITDDTEAINQAISEVSTIIFPDGTYLYSGRIRLTRTKSLIGIGQPQIQWVGVNDGIDVAEDTIIKGIKFTALGVLGYNGPMLLYDDTDLYNRHLGNRADVLNSWFDGPGFGALKSGTGIYVHGAGGAGICYVHFNNVVYQNFEYGVLLYSENSFVTSQRFINCRGGNCDYFVYLRAGILSPDGNYFIGYAHQPGAGTGIRSIYCEGRFNTFYAGQSWDWNAAADPIAIELVGNDNDVVDFVPAQRIKNHATKFGVSNFIKVLTGDYLYKTVSWSSPPSSQNPNFYGNDGDCLAWSHLSRDVIYGGDVATNPNNPFIPNSLSAVWASLSSATIKIDFGAPVPYFFGAGVKFGFGDLADNITIATSVDDITYTDRWVITENEDYDVGFCSKDYLADFRYLRYTISNVVAKTTRLQRCYAFISDENSGVYLLKDENSARGVVSSQISSNVEVNTAKADSTAIQHWFPSPYDILSIESGTFKVEADFFMDRTAGTTAHTLNFIFGGSAVVDAIRFSYITSNDAVGVQATSQVMGTITSTVGTQITPTNATADESIVVKLSGELRISTSGTFIPQFQYSSAPGGVPTVMKGTNFKLQRLGSQYFQSSGNWS